MSTQPTPPQPRRAQGSEEGAKIAAQSQQSLDGIISSGPADGARTPEGPRGFSVVKAQDSEAFIIQAADGSEMKKVRGEDICAVVHFLNGGSHEETAIEARKALGIGPEMTYEASSI